MTIQTIQEMRKMEEMIGKQIWCAAWNTVDTCVICINRNGEPEIDNSIATFGDDDIDIKRANFTAKLRNNAKELLDMAEYALQNGYTTK